MANTEYQYLITFQIEHPYLSVRDLNESFDGLVPTRTINVGESTRAGTKAKITVWTIDFVNPPLAAETAPLEVELANVIKTLRPYSNAVHNVTCDGSATCDITIFSGSACAVCVISAETLVQLGNIGVDFVLYFYERDRPPENERR